MNTATHTPGPWFAHKSERTMLAPGLRRFGWTIMPNSGMAAVSIADLTPGTTTDRIEPIAEANAKLIAAAPDMLAALRQVLEFMDNGTPLRPGALLVDDIRAAVAKATA